MKLRMLVTLKVACLLFLLSGCSTTVPKEYVGIWASQNVVLEVQNTGMVEYAEPNHRLSFTLSEITNNKISGYLSLLTSISIEGPPQVSEDGVITLMVEDEKLYKQSDAVVAEINAFRFYNAQARSNKVKHEERRGQSLKEFGRNLGNDIAAQTVTSFFCSMTGSCD